jgi:hypothetical protein
MKSARMIAAAAMLQAAMLIPAFAQPATIAASGDDQAEIVVTAPQASGQNQVRGFVRALTSPGRYAALPRWTGELCPGVVGLDAEHARALNDRVARVAIDLGIRVGRPGCNADVVVYFTQDGAAAAAALSGRNGPVSTQSGSREAVRDFVERPRPVRWWYVSTRTADGFEIERNSDTSMINTQRPDISSVGSGIGGGGGGDRGGGEGGRDARQDEMDSHAAQSYTNAVRVRGASRLRANTVENLARVIIIVDAPSANVRFGPLGDYIAMISLAEINPNAEVSGVPSILNLFSDAAAERPDSLTAWDLSYLRGLYRSPEDSHDATQQEGLIARSMMRSDRE